jgi:hypothetical protein
MAWSLLLGRYFSRPQAQGKQKVLVCLQHCKLGQMPKVLLSCERRSKSALFCRRLGGHRRLTAAADFPRTGPVAECVSPASEWEAAGPTWAQGAAGDDSRVIGAVIDIPALIAWAERAASRRRSVKPAAANGGGPQGQALQTDDGEQTIESAIGQCGRNATGGACGASP